MKLIHTHRGHCQLCLRVQAIDPATGRIAQHGYTVDNHYFTGTCSGSGMFSLHIERKHTDTAIRNARATVERHRIAIAALADGRSQPLEAWNSEYHNVPNPTPRNPNAFDRVRRMVPFSTASEFHQKRQVQEEIDKHERAAEYFEAYANDMQAWAAKIFDARVPAYRAVDLDAQPWTVGETVRIGGAKGYDAVIEAIEMRPYRTNGFRRGTSITNLPHARVTRPAITEKRVSEKAGGYVTREAKPAHTFWEAMRNIKPRPDSALVAELKKADKL